MLLPTLIKVRYFWFFLLSAFLFSEEISDTVYELSDFVVRESEDKGYYSANSTSITKANELVKNTPINLTVINQELLDDLGIQTTEDLAQVSATIDTDPTGYSLDQIRIRGFRNIFSRYNGFRRNLPRDSYNIARIDIIKGANSLIFGQASPGGSVNAIPLIANFRDDAGSINFSFGNKDYQRLVYNYNKVINDQLAARFMALDHFQGYEHDYKTYDLNSQTLSLNYRPNEKQSLVFHIENIDADFHFPSLALRDNTFIDDSDLNGNMMTGSKYDGYLSVSENSSYIRDYHVPFTSEWLKVTPQGFIDNLIIQTQNNTEPKNFNVNGSGINIENREDLINYYSIIDENNYGYQSGPDKNKAVSGTFLTAELQKIISDDLEFSLALNFQENSGRNIARDAYGITRIIDSYSNYGDYPRTHTHIFDLDGNVDPFIRTYWTKTEGDSDRGGAKATLLWEHTTGSVEHKILLGWDYHFLDKIESQYDQTFASVINEDGSYKTSGSYDADSRHAWVTNNKITDRELAFEYIDISQGFGTDRSIIRFNDLVESDFYITDFGYTIPTGLYRSDADKINIDPNDFNNALFTEGVRDEPAVWGTNNKLTAKVNTNSQWFAGQSNFLKGRLRTLFGLRLDDISVESTLRKVSIYGHSNNPLFLDSDGDGFVDAEGIATDRRLDNHQKESYFEVSPSIGALYWLNPHIGIFGNYAESIETPTGQDRTPLGTLAPPELGKGLEAGLRFTEPNGKLEGQLAFYTIEKENDNEFFYSDNLLEQIFPFDTYGADYPENYNEQTGRLLKGGLPGRRGVGDVTESNGFEVDLNYNPSRNLSFIASFHKNLKNDIKELHPLVENYEDYELFGRPKYRASLTGRYRFLESKFKGLSCGLSYQYRSGSNQTKFNFYFDENDSLIDDKDSAVRTETFYLKFKDEHNTLAFVNYKGKFGKGKDALRYSLNFRVNNLLDKRQFINRGNYGFYRESRSYTVSTKINF